MKVKSSASMKCKDARVMIETSKIIGVYVMWPRTEILPAIILG